MYLGNLMIGRPLDAGAKKNFFEDYFSVSSPIGLFFQHDPKGLVEFREMYFEEFSKLLKNRIYLSGEYGVVEAYFESKDKSNSGDVSRNIFRMAYQMMLDFEKTRIEKLIKAKAAHNGEGLGENLYLEKYHGLLAQGKLKLVKMPDGTEEFLTQEQIKAKIAEGSQLEVVPFIETGLGEKMLSTNPGTELPLAPTWDGTSSMNAGTMAGAGAVAGAGAAVAGTSAAYDSTTIPEVKSTFAKMKDDFKSSQIASIEMDLEKNGLEIAQNFELIWVDKDGKQTNDDSKKDHQVFQGKVKDVNGKELIVMVNPDLNYTDGKKIIFIFADDPNKKHFYKSQQDLKDFREPPRKDGTPGNRKSAEEVLHPESSEVFAIGKSVEFPGEPRQMPQPEDSIHQIAQSNKSYRGGTTGQGRLAISQTEAVRRRNNTENFRPVQIPNIVQAKAATEQSRLQTDTAAPINTPANPSQTPPIAPAGTEQQQPEKPKKRNWQRWGLVAAATGVPAAGVAAAGLGAVVAGSTPDQSKTVVMLVLHCLGVNCLT